MRSGKFHAYPFDIRAGLNWAVSSSRAILSSVVTGAGADMLLVVYSAAEGGELFSQFFEKFDNRVRVHK